MSGKRKNQELKTKYKKKIGKNINKSSDLQERKLK